MTLPGAIQFGLVDTINRARGTHITPVQFLADCRARARDDEIFEQSYLCNPLGAASNHVVEWSAIERCRSDYAIERVHLEADQMDTQFGEFKPFAEQERKNKLEKFLRDSFAGLFASKKHDLGFVIMNQLSVAEKRFPKSEADIAADFFALRKMHTGTKWAFSETRNTLNPASHCDIAWAGALVCPKSLESFLSFPVITRKKPFCNGQ